jgi:outer membrane protein TolC
MLRISKSTAWVYFLASLLPLNALASPTLDLDQAVSAALQGNPGLAEIDARAKALAQVPDQVGTLPDPTLSFGALSLPTDTFSLTQEAMTQMQVGIGLTLPFPGKLGLRKEAAGFEAKAASYDVTKAQQVLVRNVRSTWWNLFYLDRAIGIVKQNQTLFRGFVKVAERKYETGQGMQSDVLLAQVELSKLLDIELSLEASRRSQSARLGALLGRNSALPIRLPDHAEESLPSLPEEAVLYKVALKNNPALESLRSSIKAAGAKVALAEKDYYPDFKIGAAYGSRQGFNANGSPRADLASFTVSMNLPIFTDTKQDRALDQRKAEEMKSKFAFQDGVVQVDEEIDSALANLKASQEKTSLYKSGIIPQASQTVSSMLSSYQVDKTDFLNLVRAQVTLYNYENEYWKALSSGWQAWAILQSEIGAPVKKDLNHE